MQLYIECLLLAVAGVGETNACLNPLRGKKQGNAGRDVTLVILCLTPLLFLHLTTCTHPHLIHPTLEHVEKHFRLDFCRAW